MGESKIETNRPVPETEEEDKETLAAIDKGASDADAGRVTPIEEVEQMLSRWISKSSSRPKR